MNKQKILIVGGGISGLVAGVYAQLAGFDAEIYEKNHVAGGECTGWDREGFHIDNCIHWLMGTTPGTELNKIWRTSGALGDDTKILTSDSMYISELNSDRLTLWKDIDRTEREMIALSPEDEVEIRKLIADCRKSEKVQIPAYKPSELLNFRDLFKMLITMGSALSIMKAYKGQDTTDLMNKFKHPLIRCMISDFCTK
jgi:phytoene dehydrogenase-like protein